jgi:glucokinase
MLSEDNIVTLQDGEPQPQSTRAVIGAGTGLGHGILVWQQDHYEVVSSEGGHVDFAPLDENQIGLLRFLKEQNAHVSYEMVCSGPGLENIYRYVTSKHGATRNASAAEVTELALQRDDSLAKLALDMFIEIYGAQAGNLALMCVPRGGLFIAGGIAPKIIQRLQHGDFVQAFNRKSKMQALLHQIPVAVVINAKVGLLGAAAKAAREAAK